LASSAAFAPAARCGPARRAAARGADVWSVKRKDRLTFREDWKVEVGQPKAHGRARALGIQARARRPRGGPQGGERRKGGRPQGRDPTDPKCGDPVAS